jgi:geranylgeranyl diphosphate synthase type I
MAAIAHVQGLLDVAAVTPAYREALHMTLALPGNILSDDPNLRWSRLVWTCCAAAGGDWERALPAAAAAEIFMVALDVLDDEEDCEDTQLRATLGPARTLNVSTGLLLLAQQALLDTEAGVAAVRLLLKAGLRACAGQHADLTPTPERCVSLNGSLTVAGEKSASLVAAICRLGALCAGADAPLQELYGRFGWNVGMAAQLTNDIAAIRPDALGKTDIALERPALPLTYAALLDLDVDPHGDAAEARDSLWKSGARYFTWIIAETYRRRALDLVPQLAIDYDEQTVLAALLDEP